MAESRISLAEALRTRDWALAAYLLMSGVLALGSFCILIVAVMLLSTRVLSLSPSEARIVQWLVIAYLAVRWISAVRSHGSRVLLAARETMRLSAWSIDGRRRLTYLWGYLLCAMGFSVLSSGIDSPAWALTSSLLCVAMSLLLASALALPPSILFLTASGEQSYVVMRNLKIRSFPRRVVSLLPLDSSANQGRVHVFGYSNFRATDVDWEMLASRLLAICRFVVLDARTISEPVRWEIGLLIREEIKGVRFD